MPRFVLVDQSLRGYAGHFYAYAEQCLVAAQRLGLQTSLISHRTMDATVCGGTDVYPAFRYGSGERPLSGISWLRPGGTEGSPPSPGSIDRHASGDSASHEGRQTVFDLADRVSSPIRNLIKRRSFARDFVRSIQPLHLTAHDHLFLPTVHPIELIPILRAAAAACPDTPLHVLLRDDFDPSGANSSTQERYRRYSVSQMRAFCRVRTTHTRVYTDSELLKGQYAAVAGLDATVLPIPITPIDRDREPRPFTISYLGEAKDEKGFQLLPEIVRSVLGMDDQPSQTRFSIQTNIEWGGQRRSSLALQELKALSDPRVVFIDCPLDDEEYSRVLSQSDLILIPYDATAYRARTSGILAEALTAGIPAVVPGGTWMAAAMNFHGPSIAGAICETPDDFAASVVAVMQNYNDAHTHAQSASAWWRANMTGEALCGHLLASP